MIGDEKRAFQGGADEKDPNIALSNWYWVIYASGAGFESVFGGENQTTHLGLPFLLPLAIDFIPEVS
jgi:hypothetical protein